MEGDCLPECGERHATTTSSPPSPANIQSLPQEMLIHIFSYLSPTVLCHTVPRVCALWEALHRDPSLYNSLSFREDDDIDTVMLCMQRTRSLRYFSLVDDHDRTMFRKLQFIKVCKYIGHTLRSFTLKLTSTIHRLRLAPLYTYNIKVPLCLEITCALLSNCPNLLAFHIEGFTDIPFMFYTRPSEPKRYDNIPLHLRILRLVNNKSFGNVTVGQSQSENCYNFVTKCSQLEELTVSRCGQGEIPLTFTGDQLNGMCKHLHGTLRVLHLQYDNNWSPEALKSLTMCHSLQDLCFHGARNISDECLLVIGSLTRLRKLRIENSLKPKERGWIRMIKSPALKSLESFELYKCVISNELALAVGENLRKLRTLHLSNSSEKVFHRRPSFLLSTGFLSIIVGCQTLEKLSLCCVNNVVNVFHLIPHYLPRLQELAIVMEQCVPANSMSALKAEMPYLRVRLGPIRVDNSTCLSLESAK